MKKTKTKKIKKNQENNSKIASIIILLIMIFSIAGFALISAGPTSPQTNKNQDIPFGQNYQNPQTGEIYFGARINGEEFIFLNGIEGFETNSYIQDIALQIRNQDKIKIYIDPNFTSQESIFLIEKVLKATKKTYTITNSIDSCSKDILYLTYNSTKSGCIEFETTPPQAYNNTENLIYFLIQ